MRRRHPPSPFAFAAFVALVMLALAPREALYGDECWLCEEPIVPGEIVVIGSPAGPWMHERCMSE